MVWIETPSRKARGNRGGREKLPYQIYLENKRAYAGQDGRELVTRDQILTRERGKGNPFPCAAGDQQD